MCFEYERQYPRGCFDSPFLGAGYDLPPALFVQCLEHVFGMKVVDGEKFADERYELFEIFKRWHDEGIVRPMTEREVDSLDERVALGFDKIEKNNHWYKEKNVVAIAID